MPKDASATREALIRAGAHLFAAHGIDAARTRDIVHHAGQANDSAITYHFGSRAGLLNAVLRNGITRMEPARAAPSPHSTPATSPPSSTPSSNPPPTNSAPNKAATSSASPPN